LDADMQEIIAVAKVVFWAVLLSRISMAITTDLELRKKNEINRQATEGVHQIMLEKAARNGM
jgi:hypothetical protein